jgi:hypothetical protein
MPWKDTVSRKIQQAYKDKVTEATPQPQPQLETI